MKVTLDVFKELQSAVYDGEFNPDLVHTYNEFAEFAGTDFQNAEYVKLVEGLINLEVID